MKVLLYFEGMKYIKKSGVGRALKHQMKALESQGIEYTLDPKDSFDIAHINTYGIKSSRLLKRCKNKVFQLFIMLILHMRILEIHLFYPIKLHHF